MRLLPGSQPGPKRIKCRGIFVGRSLLGREVVIEKETAAVVPQILHDQLFSFEGFLPPMLGLVLPAKETGHILQILLRFIEQTVEADRRVVMGLRAKRSEAK